MEIEGAKEKSTEEVTFCWGGGGGVSLYMYLYTSICTVHYVCTGLHDCRCIRLYISISGEE